MNSFTLTMHARARRIEFEKNGKLLPFLTTNVFDNKIIIHLQRNEKQQHHIIAEQVKKIA